MRVATRRRRRGTASVELALLLPVLAFILVAAVDFARVFRAYTVVTWCARDGAVYGSGSSTKSTDTTGIQTAALADASDLSPQPTVTSTTGTGTDTDGNNSTYTYVAVTVTYTFNTIAYYPGIPSTVNLSRTVKMQVSP